MRLMKNVFNISCANLKIKTVRVFSKTWKNKFEINKCSNT